MPIVNPDTSEMMQFTTLEPGVYPGKIISADVKTAKSGNLMTTPEVEITVGDQTVKRTAYLVIAGKGSGGFDSLLRACGFDAVADEAKAGGKPAFNTDDLIGLQVNVQIENEVYEGKVRDSIRGFLKH